MTRLATRGFLAIGMAAIVAVCTVGRAAEDELKVGDPAPDFKLQGSDGKIHSLSDYKGKSAVVLAWFPKAFTPGCTKQCTSYGKDGKELKTLNVKYFTVSVDPHEKNTKFAQSVGADYPILSDPEKKAAEKYGVLNVTGLAKRWTFYIDKEGFIREIDKSVDAANAAPDTVAKIKALGLND
jgi:peroxiredoxin Q/BCP